MKNTASIVKCMKKIANGRITKYITLLILIFLIFLKFTLTSYAALYTVNVTKRAQEKSNWCWAACAEMVGKYYGGFWSQSSICNHVKGNTYNYAASIAEVIEALRFSTNKVVINAGVVALNAFITELQNRRPATLRIEWDSGSGHMYVVYGAQEQIGPAVGGLHLIDPISGVSNAFYSYTSLVNGTNLTSGRGKYTNTWCIV